MKQRLQSFIQGDFLTGGGQQRTIYSSCLVILCEDQTLDHRLCRQRECAEGTVVRSEGLHTLKGFVGT